MLFRPIVAAFAILLPLAAQADPVLEATEELRNRLVAELGATGVVDMEPGAVESQLTAEEEELFGSGYITFTVDEPVIVNIYRDDRLARVNEPFWLEARGFEPTGQSAEAYGKDFEVWSRTFPAGEIGLGIHAFRVVREHYLVSVAGQDDGGPVEIRDLTPADLTTGTVELGAETYIDRSVTLDAVSDDLLGQTLIRTASDRRPVAAVYRYYRLTDTPATAEPDQILLTVTADPSTAMAVQWRTDVTVESGQVALWSAADFDRPARPEPVVFEAQTVVQTSERTVNQTQIHRHSAVLDGLAPDTAYVYAVRGTGQNWSSVARFQTAPAGDAPVSFLYFGDVQEGFDRFESVLSQALRERPDPDFVIFAGDLVSRGTDADNWDDFFAVLDNRLRGIPVVPAVGNHELQPADSAAYYRDLFALPENGPEGVDAERAYHFEWGGAGVVVLDSNLNAEDQTAWLTETLGGFDDRLNVVVSHHAAHTSRPGRYYGRVAEHWAPVIEDSNKVAMVLQGHDHAYLRTPPMRGGLADPEGTGPVYVISTAGEKFYDQDNHDYIEVGITEMQMFQIIDVLRDEDRMVYRAFDLYGDERDRVIIDGE